MWKVIDFIEISNIYLSLMMMGRLPSKIYQPSISALCVFNNNRQRSGDKFGQYSISNVWPDYKCHFPPSSSPVPAQTSAQVKYLAIGGSCIHLDIHTRLIFLQLSPNYKMSPTLWQSNHKFSTLTYICQYVLVSQ